MSRTRAWPVLLATLSLAILGSYLVYTEYLVREIRAEAAVHTRMYALVQEGLLAVDPDAEMEALWELQHEITQLGVPIVVLDPDGSPTAVENLPFEADLAEPEDRARVLEYVERLDRRHQPVEGPVGTIHYGPPPITSWLRWIPWLQVSGALLLLALAFGLIQVSLRAERERFWAAMARELAHQMGTPLSSLAGWIEVLRLPPAERERAASSAHVAEEIARDVERLERVSRRFELIGQKPAREPVAIGSVLEELDRYITPRLPKRSHGIRFSHRIAADVPPVRANAVLLVWAFENILKNALDALATRPDGGRIRVAALDGKDDFVQVVVSDNGPGVAPEVKGRLFEAGVTTKPAGWGVGLSLARRIIEDVHDGDISVRDRRGGGTVFLVKLPKAAQA